MIAPPGLVAFPEGSQPRHDRSHFGALEGARQHCPQFRGGTIRRDAQGAIDRQLNNRKIDRPRRRMSPPLVPEALIEKERPRSL